MTQRLFRPSALVATLGLILCGCPGSNSEPVIERIDPVPGGVVNQPAESSGASSANLETPTRVKLKRDGGATAYEWKSKDDGAKVVDANEQELFRLKVSGGKTKIRDPQDKTLFVVSGDAAKLKLKDGEQTTTLFALQRQDDGDYKLEGPDGAILVKIKRRDYGWKLVDEDENELAKVKDKDGKRSLRDAADQTLLYTKDGFSLLALAVLGLKDLSEPQQLALAHAVNRLGL